MSRSTLVGLLFKLNVKYPVYDSDDEVIGYTDPSDVAVVVFDDSKSEVVTFKERKVELGDYIELTVASGRWAGYDNLALNKADIKKATLIGLENYKSVVASGIKIR